MNKNLNLNDAARYLCVSMSKMYKLCHKNKITYHKVGIRNVFTEEELNSFLSKNTVFSNYDLAVQAESQLLKIGKNG